MIKKIKLKFGRSRGSKQEIIDVTPVTVFVGPNNSGKSQVLSEINNYCSHGHGDRSDVIVEYIEFATQFNEEEAECEIPNLEVEPRENESVHPAKVLISGGGIRYQVQPQQLANILANPNGNPEQFCKWYLASETLMLDGKGRIDLVGEQPGGDLQKSPQSSFQVLFREDDARLEVRRIIKDAFAKYFVLDATNLGKLRIKLSDDAPSNHLEERGIHEEAVEFHAEALSIEDASDGVKAFVGMVTEIIAGDPNILLVDEPEAFLHPSLSYNLGREIAQASSTKHKRIFASTHSPDFVMGCIRSGTPVNIVRLTYQNDLATARILANDEILRLMRNPLLRSTGVLSGLFYKYVIVTESDADRAFYEEVNERLLRYKPEWAIPNCLFLNAQNKQTVKVILEPLREMGIPAAGIVDIDVVKDGGSVWTSFLRSGSVPDISHQSFSQLRVAVKDKLRDADGNMKRDGGISLLNDSDKEAANNLFNQLDEYGLFVVRGGELESWLSHLGAGGHGPNWLIDVFDEMGEDPDSASYVKPSDDGVWQFMGVVKNWLTNSERKGIPE